MSSYIRRTLSNISYSICVLKISLKEVSILESGPILFSAFNSYDTSMILSGYFCTGSKDEKLYFEYICDYYYYYFSSPHVSELTLFIIYHNSLIIDINKSKIRPFCSFCNVIVLKVTSCYYITRIW